ncbi:hypothetical protein [Oscillibacter sp.]|uniref:hypothetical protein n=1 Tax=Oscillibacter sp. TaxID=1945593 RepID=UPI0026170C13|nr:hypothetical protein [Oscillibacter sp.]MDD3347464.1 hypothetical protein [Oscillibacter sp.]
MDAAEAAEVLNQCFDGIFSTSTYALARRGYRRMKAQVVSRSFPVKDGSPEKFLAAALEALNHLPVLLLEEPAPACIRVVMGSGAANLNPAVMEIVMTDGMCCVTAWAKEGLIHQKTAEKAIDRFQTLMESV